MSGKSPEAWVRCWSCAAQRGLADLLDATHEVVCQPICDSFTVACPGCGAEIWLDLNATSVAVGQLIGFGARPDVEDYQSVRLGSPVEVDFGERTISYSGKVWRYR
jgi:hypothetical protein